MAASAYNMMKVMSKITEHDCEEEGEGYDSRQVGIDSVIFRSTILCVLIIWKPIVKLFVFWRIEGYYRGAPNHSRVTVWCLVLYPTNAETP